MVNVGVISDTHGLVRPEALDYLSDCSLIVHAGDIGKPEVISALEGIAPVIAIRGNIDKGAWAQEFPEVEVVEVEGCHLYVLHSLQDLDLDPVAAGFQVVVSGHSHIPKVEEKDGVLYLNPGSAGPRRFKLPISLAKLRISGTDVDYEQHEIAV